MVISALKETNQGAEISFSLSGQGGHAGEETGRMKRRESREGQMKNIWVHVTWKVLSQFTKLPQWHTRAGSPMFHHSDMNLAFRLTYLSSFASSWYQFLHLYNGANTGFDWGELLLGRIQWDDAFYHYLIRILLHLHEEKVKKGSTHVILHTSPCSGLPPSWVSVPSDTIT